VVDSVNIANTPAPGAVQDEAAHAAAMAAKFDAQGQPAPAPEPAADDLIAGKFKTQEDLVKAYKELEAKLGAPKDPPKPTPDKPANPLDLSVKADETVAEAGLDMGALTNEYMEKGTLSDEAFAKLAKVGINKDMVEAYVEGQKARAATLRASLFESAGVTEQSFGDMVKWAQANLSKEDLQAYNDSVGPGASMGVQRLALEAMHQRFVRAQTRGEPNLVRGARGSVQDSGGEFQSQAEVTAAMRDPRYARDVAYRNAVQAKLARSNF